VLFVTAFTSSMAVTVAIITWIATAMKAAHSA
jgi:hypothetical protein